MIGDALNTVHSDYERVPAPTTRRKEVTDQKIVGRVIKVSKKGWGFVSSKEIEFTRIFFHWTGLRQDTIPFLEMKVGMWVEFTPLQIEGKGWRAVHIRTVDRPKPTMKEAEDGEATTEASEGTEVSPLSESGLIPTTSSE